ncbi:hypothetical protein F5144DRAFT_561222 [Chaetomium tenue]|uniref:Uncharacterized protein n=1 Tax=Chaetomium tenue TaxID=1854479 RepID=A0ACB7PGL4_9PEZI|nr:hypothetical protein F5144DRAFT_561222 [Chaetomium globosum]
MSAITVFRKFPKELFRVNNGRAIRVRAQTPHRHVYDIITSGNGWVEPKALNLSTYMAPNGASMRPNSRYQQYLVSWRFRGDDVVVYSIPKDTNLPDDLLLVHERSDHYSLQPAVRMSLDRLNARITQFLSSAGKVYTREEWLKTYPTATNPS